MPVCDHRPRKLNILRHKLNFVLQWVLFELLTESFEQNRADKVLLYQCHQPKAEPEVRIYRSLYYFFSLVSPRALGSVTSI